MKPRLLFRHGWAFDHTVWDRVLNELGQKADGAVMLDAGYYGAPMVAPEIDGPVLGVGHSLGALELLTDPPPRLVGVVALDGFARFGRAKDFPEGVPARILRRMANDILDGSSELFLEQVDGPPAPEDAVIDAERLRQGMERLETWDGRGATAVPIWRLHAQGDTIATLAMADASFAGMNVVERRLLRSDSHLSPIHDPQACADLIRAALVVLS